MIRQLNVRKSFSFTIFFLFLILYNNQIQPHIIFKEYTKCHMSIQHMLKGGTIKKKQIKEEEMKPQKLSPFTWRELGHSTRNITFAFISIISLF